MVTRIRHSTPSAEQLDRPGYKPFVTTAAVSGKVVYGSRFLREVPQFEFRAAGPARSLSTTPETQNELTDTGDFGYHGGSARPLGSVRLSSAPNPRAFPIPVGIRLRSNA